ncbi:MAG: 50S ribosomal protein L15 [Actinobacteria bacterium]|nr:50S ribosomal protein L15 [Actinomycetota bacterium]
MKLHHLKPAPGAHRKRTRKGRGEAAGKGKTAGRGTKGTGARGTMRIGFEGGQTPLQQRLPKLPGFTPRNRVEYATVNVGRLDGTFDDGAEVTPATLREAGLIRRGNAPVKILGDGELSTRLTVSAHAFSSSAERKITDAGGRADVLGNDTSAAATS